MNAPKIKSTFFFKARDDSKSSYWQVGLPLIQITHIQINMMTMVIVLVYP